MPSLLQCRAEQFDLRGGLCLGLPGHCSGSRGEQPPGQWQQQLRELPGCVRWAESSSSSRAPSSSHSVDGSPPRAPPQSPAALLGGLPAASGQRQGLAGPGASCSRGRAVPRCVGPSAAGWERGGKPRLAAISASSLCFLLSPAGKVQC